MCRQVVNDFSFTLQIVVTFNYNTSQNMSGGIFKDILIHLIIREQRRKFRLSKAKWCDQGSGVSGWAGLGPRTGVSGYHDLLSVQLHRSHSISLLICLCVQKWLVKTSDCLKGRNIHRQGRPKPSGSVFQTIPSVMPTTVAISQRTM